MVEEHYANADIPVASTLPEIKQALRNLDSLPHPTQQPQLFPLPYNQHAFRRQFSSLAEKALIIDLLVENILILLLFRI